MTILDEIQSTIKKALPSAEVQVLDPMNDGTHLEAIVIDQQFAGMPLVRQHQIVMNSLKEQFNTSLHALALKTFTPEQWQQRNPS